LVEVSAFIEASVGLSVAQWKNLVGAFGSMSYAGVFICDHFTPPGDRRPDNLEAIIALGYLADHSTGLHFGPMVSPVSFRDPIMLARQAQAIDDLSGGRMILGVGAGWQQREHDMFGYPLGDVKTRLDRLEEALQVITLLYRSDEPVSFEGKFYRLADAQFQPRPLHPGGPRIMIGGMGVKRTLALTARYADIWNGGGKTPDGFREYNAILDGYLAKEGRPASAVKRTLMVNGFAYRNDVDLTRRLEWYRTYRPVGEGLSNADTVAAIQARSPAWLMGSPAEVAAKIRALGEAGVQEVMFQWFDPDDVEGLRLISDEVIPLVK
jgi:alkanesulfonate monooxygenase SsuD/methylene tetrahydromethanopterin reductase-like flavin-dependent oxidoreductase (luciferase family)